MNLLVFLIRDGRRVATQGLGSGLGLGLSLVDRSLSVMYSLLGQIPVIFCKVTASPIR